MAVVDKNYHNLLEKIIQEGYTYEDPNRKGVNRIEIPSYTFRHEFKDGFPAITTKKLNYKSVVTELIWFLRGDTNIKYLVDNGVNIWNKDAYNYYLKSRTKEKYNDCYCGHTTDCECGTASIDNFIDGIKNGSGLGDLGPVYGKQWRNRNGVDQFKDLIENLKNKPLEARHYVDAWNPEEKHLHALPPCHYGFQVVVKPLPIHKRKEKASEILGSLPKLSTGKEYEKFLDENDITKYGFELHWNQMSCDTFLGLPFNIASYATLALILEKITGYKALAIQGDLKKVHLYDNSLDAVKEQLNRDVNQYDKCELKMDTLTEVQFQSGIKYINEIEPGSFKLVNYESYPHIKVEMLERDE